MDRSRVAAWLDRTLGEADPSALGEGKLHARGKVREIWTFGDRLVILTSDRVSAFDRVLTTIPCKGEILNRISLFWFNKTTDIVANHIIESPSPRAVIVRRCDVVPIEVVVRGYLTGSAWRDYEKSGKVSGIGLPSGLREYQQFPQPLLTPSTKESEGHDRPISREEIMAEGRVTKDLWLRIESVAQSLFRRGTEIAGANGLILVDTKYEFGIHDGELVLIDEIHTPDSSRFWYASDYADRFARGERPRQLDKEYLRRWLMEQGFMGDGQPPVIPDDVRVETSLRYVEAYERITGTTFEAQSGGAEQEFSAIRAALAQ
jgi:phosphoribosylaminoimidazole-succinocarboxamide synthase